MSHQVMVAAFDPDGLPRAWGVAADERTARMMVAHQLMLYRDQKRAVGDKLADAVFRFEVIAEEG